MIHRSIDIKQSEPFPLETRVDLRREDHPDHNYRPVDKFERENLKILKYLKEISWIKNRSILDLSDLIRKYMDRQPELLAML